MDAFLRRVIAIREMEQEQRLRDGGRGLFSAGHCAECGKRLFAHPDGRHRTYCHHCVKELGLKKNEIEGDGHG